jgi:hypothetical protein
MCFDGILGGANLLIVEIDTALSNYRTAISKATSQQEVEDYSTLVVIVEKICAEMKSEDFVKIKPLLLGFSRQVSDSYSPQPPEYRALADCIDRLRKLVIQSK